MSLPFPFRIALILVLSVISVTLRAQDLEQIKTWSAEEFAQKLTDEMTTRAPLTQEQVEPVNKINLKFAEQVLPVVNGSDDPNAKLATVKRLDRERSVELKVFLTPEQMRQVKQVQTENRKKLKQSYYQKNL